MFNSFFPKPKRFLSMVIIWGCITVIVWQVGGSFYFAEWLNVSKTPPVSIVRFWSGNYLIFYTYYAFCVGIFSLYWFIFHPHSWQKWSILGSALIVFVAWFLVDIGVTINAWYAPFYDLIQAALSKPNSVSIAQFYHEIVIFLGIALVAVVVGVLNNFFVSHYVFRWRTAMSDYYTNHWSHLRHIEGAAQRVQEDTMRFASTMESLGIGLIKAIMTLIAFLPILIHLSVYVPVLPIIGHVPYGLVIAALIWSIAGTGMLAIMGIKLPGLHFKNQRAEAAYRKELVYGEDDDKRASPLTVKELFNDVRINYFQLYWHYVYFNIARILYLQIDNIIGILLLLPSIITGAITLGLMTQILNVFEQVRSAFQYLINSWTTLVELMSIYKRLQSFEQELVHSVNENN
ncbi:peptide antibiotic transporter SbmA [Bartonella sp. cb54]|uniref:peptide antibiotic transporter SbmA n=1 Tax=Bartonella sp. cb54 TaxID=3385560 RepID=UPI0039A43775